MLLDERGLLDLPFLALTVLLVLIGVVMVFFSLLRPRVLSDRQLYLLLCPAGDFRCRGHRRYAVCQQAELSALAQCFVHHPRGIRRVPDARTAHRLDGQRRKSAGSRLRASASSPRELAKIAIIMTFSAMISTYRDKMRTFRYGIAPFGAIMIVLCGLVALERHFFLHPHHAAACGGHAVSGRRPDQMVRPRRRGSRRVHVLFISRRRATPEAVSPPGATPPPTRQTTAIRSYSRSTPSVPAA